MIGIVLHLLVDVLDDIRLQLIQFAELSKAALDNESQSFQKMCLFRVGGEGGETFDELFEKIGVDEHVAHEICVRLHANQISNVVNFQDLLYGPNEV